MAKLELSEAQRIARSALEANSDLLRLSQAAMRRKLRRMRDEFSEGYVLEVEENAPGYFWEAFASKIRNQWGEIVASAAPHDALRLAVVSAARSAVWRARRAASHARRFSESKGTVSEPASEDCPVEDRPGRGWNVAEFVGRVRVAGENQEGSKAARLSAQLKALSIMSAMGRSLRDMAENLGVSHETVRARLRTLAEFLPGAKAPPDDSEASLAELELQIGAREVRGIVSRRRRAAQAAADDAARAEYDRHAGAGRARRCGATTAAERSASEAAILRGGFRRPGLSREQAARILDVDARRIARMLDGLRPIGARRIDWQATGAADVETAPLSSLLEAPAPIDRQAIQAAHDAQRYQAAGARIAARIQAARLAAAENS